MDNSKKIDFRFKKCWKIFTSWYLAYEAKAKCAPMWDDQAKKIESSFDSLNPNIVEWSMAWSDFVIWYRELLERNGSVSWKAQQRQIETLMLNQLSNLNKKQFVLVFLISGVPEMDVQKMTYFDAVRTKKQLEGDSNGYGGNENLDKITVVNLAKLII